MSLVIARFDTTCVELFSAMGDNICSCVCRFCSSFTVDGNRYEPLCCYNRVYGLIAHIRTFTGLGLNLAGQEISQSVTNSDGVLA
jgi:hypothetical protein